MMLSYRPHALGSIGSVVKCGLIVAVLTDGNNAEVHFHFLNECHSFCNKTWPKLYPKFAVSSVHYCE